MKKFILLLALLFGVSTFAQTLDELKAEQKSKKDSIAALQAKVDAIQGQIDACPDGELVLSEPLAPAFQVLTTGILKMPITHLPEILE